MLTMSTSLNAWKSSYVVDWLDILMSSVLSRSNYRCHYEGMKQLLNSSALFWKLHLVHMGKDMEKQRENVSVFLLLEGSHTQSFLQARLWDGKKNTGRGKPMPRACPHRQLVLSITIHGKHQTPLRHWMWFKESVAICETLISIIEKKKHIWTYLSCLSIGLTRRHSA